MKKAILFIFLLSLIITACKHSDKKTNNLLSKDKLLSQVFSINTNKDTALITANGAIITIPQGALSNAGNATVQLEIKEAYSMEQIIMAGLTTQSNGQPLSSGGMIYINAVGGQSLKITKALSIKIPTPSIDKNMKLFKGDTDANGNINWVKPESLPENPQSVALDNGKALFMNNCASCHSIRNDGTGPSLAHILARTPDKKLLYEYTRNNVKIMGKEGNSYYQCLYERWNKTPMSLFTELTDPDLDNLYGYLENESKIRNLPIPKDEIRPCIDSCRTYREIKYKLESQKNKLSKEKVDMVIQQAVNPPLAITPAAGPTYMPAIIDDKVQPVNNQSLFYQFNIQTFGWYNIDMLLKDANSPESSLVVSIRGQYKQNINMYFMLPSSKVLLPGGLLQGKIDAYGFDTKDGKIPLPQNTDAIVFAVGEFEDKIIFAKQEFITGTSQEFEMILSTTTKESFETTIKKLNLADIQITVKDTQNADTLRKLIQAVKDVEKIKPKNCDCNCGLGIEGLDQATKDTSAKR